jgi:hypothetical protein
MQKAFQIKADVINELKNDIYYNQVEINKLLTTEVAKTHKQVVRNVADLLQENVVAMNAIQLLEEYLPTPQQAPESKAPAAESVDGITKAE